MSKRKLVALSAMMLGGATLFEGCLSSFWQGLWKTGFPADNQWIDLALDVLREDLFS
ncbi:MAG: hypothetical protein JXO22_18240 [Phycisphaerae bacterium]|nr:hypothetical protein [Phycisphaerae bacterium]